jgi:hypothetical protein
MAPFTKGRGGELKRALVRASIEASNAIWKVAPEAKLLNVDPLVRIHVPTGRADLQQQADDFNSSVVTEAFDMLAGRREPELGGSRAHLGIVGLNYYACNQWTIATPEQPQSFLNWHDPRWIPLATLLKEVEERYGGPIVIAETGAAGEQRPEWVAHLSAEARKAIDLRVDLQGVCWYPLITSPDWEDPTAFFEGGLFDVVPEPDGTLRRVVAQSVAVALREAQSELDPDHVSPEIMLPQGSREPEQDATVLQPIEQARFKADNFSYEVLAAGDSLLIEIYGLDRARRLPHTGIT